VVSNAIKKHILLISGDPRVLAEIKMELMGSFDISISASSDTAIAALDAYEISAVVICIGESRENAFAVFECIFEVVKNHHIPIIFLAEKGNDDDESAAFEMGAADYSARRHGTTKALISRIKLRISASELQGRMLSEEEVLSHDSISEAALAGKTILVADDININREIVAAMLSHIEGLAIDFAENGREAVEMFGKGPELYSLILMDVQMPEMDGLEATKTIRRYDHANARKVPILAMTAGISDDEISQCLGAGMDEVLEKPMVYGELLAAAEKYCS
jgi:CheY-like chemotaxis protein